MIVKTPRQITATEIVIRVVAVVAGLALIYVAVKMHNSDSANDMLSQFAPIVYVVGAATAIGGALWRCICP